MQSVTVKNKGKEKMILNEISNIRLLSQKIAVTKFKTANEIVSWMCGMQAQDYSMVKWAMGARILDSTDKQIETAIDKGEIIRTHVMRPTWHFVSAEDIHWMRELTAPQIKLRMKSRMKELELSDSVFNKSNNLIEKTLIKVQSLNRDELAKEFNNAKISTDKNRLSHLLMRAELDGIVCSGPIKGNKQTYALLNERVPHKKVLNRDESLAELAKRYFTSRCPATLQDFIAWSGLSVTDARKALESVKPGFIIEETASGKYLFPDSFRDTKPDKTSVYLLPAFDEFLISYNDRSASLSLIDNRKTISVNGIFHPVILINGQVTGIWKRTFKKNRVIIEADIFQMNNKTTRNLIEKKVSVFARFLNKEAEIRYRTGPDGKY